MGGQEEMIDAHLTPDLRDRIGWVVLKEFEGIDHLPDDLLELATLAHSVR
ncbi:MAG: hypothetical protein AB1816_09960 [Bacillota bacterium]